MGYYSQSVENSRNDSVARGRREHEDYLEFKREAKAKENQWLAELEHMGEQIEGMRLVEEELIAALEEMGEEGGSQSHSARGGEESSYSSSSSGFIATGTGEGGAGPPARGADPPAGGVDAGPTVVDDNEEFFKNGAVSDLGDAQYNKPGRRGQAEDRSKSSSNSDTPPERASKSRSYPSPDGRDSKSPSPDGRGTSSPDRSRSRSPDADRRSSRSPGGSKKSRSPKEGGERKSSRRPWPPHRHAIEQAQAKHRDLKLSPVRASELQMQLERLQQTNAELVGAHRDLQRLRNPRFF